LPQFSPFYFQRRKPRTAACFLNDSGYDFSPLLGGGVGGL